MNQITAHQQNNSRARILPETIKNIKDNYTFEVRDFCRFCDENGIEEITVDTVKDYFHKLNDDLENGVFAASTVRIKRQAVKKRIRQAMETFSLDERARLDYVLKDIEKEVKAPKIHQAPIGEEKILSVEEYANLLSRCRSEKQRLFIQFMGESGCRISECINVMLKNCRIHNGFTHCKVLGKGKIERTIMIPTELFERILDEFKGVKYLFETSTHHTYDRSYVSSQITGIGKLIGRNISAHTLRHFWATQNLANKVPLSVVSKQLGHSDVSITAKTYDHNRYSTDDAQSFHDFITQGRVLV